MRVAMPILEYAPIFGGAQRQLAALGPLLARRGVEGHVLTRAVEGAPAHEHRDGFEVHRLATGSVRALAGPRFVTAAGRRIAALEPDVVHAFSLFSPTLIAVRAHRRRGLPAIVKVLRGGSLGDAERLLRKPFASRRIAAMRRSIDRFAVISSEIDQELEALGIEAGQRVWLPNGVDSERFRPCHPAQRSELRAKLGMGTGPVAVYCGRLVPEKDVAGMVSAWAEVRLASLEPRPELWLVGEGIERPSLERMAGPGVRFAGKQEDVAPWLSAADVFVLPSRTEGLSNALLEAMAAGLAVVATRVGGAGDVLKEGRSGLLVEAGEPDALAKALIGLLEDAHLRTRLGAAARETIEAHHSLAHVADRWVEEYRGLVDRRAGAGA